MVAASVTGPSVRMLYVPGTSQKAVMRCCFLRQHRRAVHSVSSFVQTPAGLPNIPELFSSIKHQICGAGQLQAECFCRQVTGTAYDPEMFLEQEPLMGGQPPTPPRAALDVPIPLQRSHTEHESTLTASTRPGTTKQSWLYSNPLRHAEF